MKVTRVAKPEQIEAARKWYLVDAKDQIMGRVATKVAAILRGKNKPFFSPHIDTGDFVIIINADQVQLSGKKAEQKKYFHYTGYPGGAKFEMLKFLLAKNPEKILAHAIKGMLPHNRLGRKLYKKVKIYAGSDHPHEAQQPEVLALG
ncbi:50S ribosomal protein L13 [candidate division KSB1 bacterium]|nr:50S ribosomal protein L13 [candidate division KSB1 bacterium]